MQSEGRTHLSTSHSFEKHTATPNRGEQRWWKQGGLCAEHTALCSSVRDRYTGNAASSWQLFGYSEGPSASVCCLNAHLREWESSLACASLSAPRWVNIDKQIMAETHQSQEWKGVGWGGCIYFQKTHSKYSCSLLHLSVNASTSSWIVSWILGLRRYTGFVFASTVITVTSRLSTHRLQ